MNQQKFKMVFAEDGSGWGPSYWVIYSAGGNYIDDELVTMPGGNEIQKRKARKVLNLLNGEHDGVA